MSKTNQAPRADVYARVTDRIVSDLEQGVRPWLKPWSAANASDRLPLLPLRHNGTPYRGINILLLWGEACEKGYSRNIWMTYKQAEALGAQVRKGEHGSLVVYADRFTKTEANDKGDPVEREIPFMKGYIFPSGIVPLGTTGHPPEPLPGFWFIAFQSVSLQYWNIFVSVL